jgi:hypothetical protein
MEEDASKSVAQAKKRAVKKRPALANLSNQQIVVSRNALGGGAGGKEQQQNGLKLAAKVETVVVEPGNENAVVVERVVVADFSQQQQQQNRPPLQEASAAAIASLERRTVQNLYISKDEETDLELEDGRERENVCISKISLHARMQFSLGRLFSLVWIFALLLVARKQTGLYYIVLHLYGDGFGRVCEELSEKKGQNVFLRLGSFFRSKFPEGKGLGFCSRNFLWHLLPLFVLPQYTSDPFFCVGFLSDDYSSSEASGWSCKLSFQDIDHGQTDPQMCSMYAAEIYEHLRMAEVCP